MIPAQQHRTEPIPHDRAQYEWREQSARFFPRLQPLRGRATRCAQWQRTFRALVQGAATWILLRSLINTP